MDADNCPLLADFGAAGSKEHWLRVEVVCNALRYTDVYTFVAKFLKVGSMQMALVFSLRFIFNISSASWPGSVVPPLMGMSFFFMAPVLILVVVFRPRRALVGGALLVLQPRD